MEEIHLHRYTPDGHVTDRCNANHRPPNLALAAYVDGMFGRMVSTMLVAAVAVVFGLGVYVGVGNFEAVRAGEQKGRERAVATVKPASIEAWYHLAGRVVSTEGVFRSRARWCYEGKLEGPAGGNLAREKMPAVLSFTKEMILPRVVVCESRAYG